VTLRCEKLDENWWIEIDKLRLNQILNNFLSNAIKYTPSGEIVFDCAIEREGIHLFVKDTGIGITDEKKEKVFGRFEKLDTFAQGTGLGLSICKALVNFKKGEIGFESTLGEGSYFWAWIPCKKSSQSGSKTNSN
jgi:signal transduction histidine kinase